MSNNSIAPYQQGLVHYKKLVQYSAQLNETEFAAYAAFLNKTESDPHTCPQNSILTEFATYAAFLNKAESNLHTCLQDIRMEAGFESNDKKRNNTKDIGQLKEEVCNNKLNDNLLYEKLCHSFERYLPFLPACADAPQANPKVQKPQRDKLITYIEILACFNLALNNCRNGYTHHLHERNTLLTNLPQEPNFPEMLKALFDRSVCEVKRRFGYDDDTLRLLRRAGGDKKTNPDFAYRLFADTEVLTFSRAGLLFFTCLFLTRGEAHSLLSQMKGFKRQGDPSAQATRNVFTLFAAQPARQRIDSTLTQDRLCLDLLGELMRCPIEVYRLMHPNAQQKYHTQAPDNPNNETNNDDNPSDPAGIALLRHGDRFARLAMQYIDLENLLPNWRFQVDLGSYRFGFYHKNCIDSQQRLRILQKPLRGFGAIQEMEELRKTKWKQQFHPLLRDKDQPDDCPLPPDTTESRPYITYRYAGYHIADNRIGLYNLGSQDQSCWFGQDPDNPKNPYRNRAPHLWLSLYDLPALVLCLLLERQIKAAEEKEMAEEKAKTNNKNNTADNDNPDDEQNDSAEALLTKYYDTYIKLYDRLQNGESLSPGERIETFLNRIGCGLLRPKDLPDRLRAKLSGTSRPLARYACAKTRELLAETEQRLAVVDRPEEDVDKNTKTDKKGGKPARQKPVHEIPAGKAADFLAHDLLYLQPADKDRPKITSLNFAALQATLARYCPPLHDSLRRMLTEAKLLPTQGNSLAHPFLEELLNDQYKNNCTTKLYRNYLKRRKAYLEQCLETAKKATEGDPVAARKLQQYAFLRADRKRVADSQTLAELAKAYRPDNNEPGQTNTIALPRGFLQEHLSKLLKDCAPKENATRLTETLGKASRKNTVYLIGLYRQLVAKDETPGYYNEKRHYRLFDWIEANLKEFQKKSSEANLKEPPIGAKPKFADAKRRLKFHNDFREWAKNNGYKTEAVYTTPDAEKQEPVPALTDSDTDQSYSKLCNWLQNEDRKTCAKANLPDEVDHLLRLWKAFDDREKQLRLRQAQDQLLLMMLRNLLTRNGSNETAKLQPDELRTKALHQFTWAHLAIPHQNGYRMKVGEISLNDLGKLNTLLFDRRMQGLCLLFEKNEMQNYRQQWEESGKLQWEKKTIERNAVKEEFEQYDRLRIAAHARLLQFEKKAIEAYSLEPVEYDIKKKKKEKVEIKVKRESPYLSFVELFEEIDRLEIWKEKPKEAIDELIDIRNRFCHGGYYPDIKLVPNDCATGKGFGFAAAMYRMLDAHCKTIEQYIEANPKS